MLADALETGIIMLDERGNVLHANPVAARILGTDVASMKHHTLMQSTFSRDMQDFVLDPSRNGVARNRDFALSGGRNRTLNVTAVRFPQGLSGEPENMIVISDVTELRHLETMRRDFVANVSHELRTPLASIRAMAETLQDGALHDETVADRFLGTIIKEADRLTRISHDLLVLSDAESKDSEKQVFDLGDLAQETVTQSMPHAKERNVILSYRGEGCLNVRASRDQIEQVVVNLVDNAIKYTPTGGSVAVESRELESTVELSFCDTGIGILEEHLPRIFERFYRVDKARSRESGGTGLGLSIVKNIIESHGGTVTVASQFNRGSTFTVSLPKAE